MVIIVAISVVLFSNNKQEEAFIMATYIVGIEVFLRMVKGAPLLETGKYTTIILLFIGLYNGLYFSLRLCVTSVQMLDIPYQ